MPKNRIVKPANGWLLLVVNIAVYAFCVYAFVNGARDGNAGAVIFAASLFVINILITAGFFIVNPNQAAVLVLFGKYKGTVFSNGFWWTNPFMRKIIISLRVRNHETSKLKVNDLSGNPIEIASIVVWKVIDPYKASFEVDDYQSYVNVQSESAVRYLASHYDYDGDDVDVTLRRATDEVNERLQQELQERLELAGVKVTEARIAHLAYAPEIASEMLRRQQATAVVAARSKIVEGAVGMVEHALEELGKKKLVHLDEERKAAMVSNLLVVLCSESAATPVVNTGTLYQ